MDVIGFDGQVNSRMMSRIQANLATRNGVVLGANDLKVTAIASRRTVQVAAGAMQSGMIFASEATSTVFPDFAPPTGGRFYLVAVQFEHGANGGAGAANVVSIGGPTTTATTGIVGYPTTMPTGYRGALSFIGATTGVWHVPLAWVFVRSTDNAVQVWDLRSLRSGMPAQFATNRGVLRYARGGSGFDAWSKAPTLGFLSGNESDATRLDVPPGVYNVEAQYSLGATEQSIGYLRVEAFVPNATGVDGVFKNLSQDIRVDLGVHDLVKWSDTYTHTGGMLRIKASAIVALPSGGDVSGSVQNGTGHLRLEWKTGLAE